MSSHTSYLERGHKNWPCHNFHNSLSRHVKEAIDSIQFRKVHKHSFPSGIDERQRAPSRKSQSHGIKFGKVD